MSYELRLEIEENSPQEQSTALVAEEEHVSREEAAPKLLAARAPKRRKVSEAERLAAIARLSGSFKDMAWMAEHFEEEKRADIDREEARFRW